VTAIHERLPFTNGCHSRTAAIHERKEKIVFTSTSRADLAQSAAADVLIPVIRAAATIGFAISPCSLGFVIIAVSEQLIRSIMVGDDPEMLVSDLQNQFPNHAIELNEDDDAGLLAKVVELLERPDKGVELPADFKRLPTALQSDISTALARFVGDVAKVRSPDCQ
jgi:hypothetical protein